MRSKIHTLLPSLTLAVGILATATFCAFSPSTTPDMMIGTGIMFTFVLLSGAMEQKLSDRGWRLSATTRILGLGILVAGTLVAFQTPEQSSALLPILGASSIITLGQDGCC